MTTLTKHQIKRAKAIAYTALQAKGRKIKFVCWPAADFPKIKGIVVLEQVQQKNTEDAIERAKVLLREWAARA